MIVETEIKVTAQVDIDRFRTWLTHNGYTRAPDVGPGADVGGGERWTPNPTKPLDWAADLSIPHPANRYPGENQTITGWAIALLAPRHGLTQQQLVAEIAATHTAVEEPML